MLTYKAPVRDFRFLFDDVFDYYGHYRSLPRFAETTPDLVGSIINECAKFSENELLPLIQSGDAEGCNWVNGIVTTPTGFREAYRRYVEGGWPSMAHAETYGGQGLPPSIGMVASEIMGSANWSWSMYPGLSQGAMNTLSAHGSEKQKQLFLSKMVEGAWSGTMCLTEPHCGTDLSQVRCRAEPTDDGSYAVSGTKMFISAGDHDLTENIVHIMLARLPNAPPGTRGISLFAVPKMRIDKDGNILGPNNVSCTAIERKMGIKASATATLEFDGAQGYLVGQENKGLACMFTFMNMARLGSGMQGVCVAELASQNALQYARERLSMRSLSGTKRPDLVADPIISHPDVRKMLLTQKAIAEGGRAMIFYAERLVDEMAVSESERARKAADDRLGLITPIIKAFLTETGLDCARLGMQIFGGHGYIVDYGMEQIVRDASISTLYEGTTGIQALDLLGRKVLGDRGESLKQLTAEIRRFCRQRSVLSCNPHGRQMRQFIRPLRRAVAAWRWHALRIMLKAGRNRDFVGSASVDYLMYSGYILMAYHWAQMADASYRQLARKPDDPDFYRAKIQTAQFYFAQLLPRTRSLAITMMADPKTVMQMDEECLSTI